MDELIKKIEKWSIDRDLHNADPMKQYDKLVEEYGELVKGLNKQDEKLIKDSIGDMFVVITIMMQQVEGNLNFVMDLFSNNDIVESENVSTLTFLGILARLGQKLYSLEHNKTPYKDMAMLHITASILISLLDKTAKVRGTDLKSCVQLAYDEIKDRKGEMRDGKFVKQEDL